jgi:hypothetical protein
MVKYCENGVKLSVFQAILVIKQERYFCGGGGGDGGGGIY